MTNLVTRWMPGRRSRLAVCAAGLLGGIALLVGALAAGASAGTSISLSPASTTITTIGGTTTVTVSVTLASADAGMIAYDVTLAWNPAVIAATTADVQSGAAFIVVAASAGTGTLDVPGAKLGGGGLPCTVGEPCTLFSVTFHAVGDGIANLTLTGGASGHTMSDGSGTDIEPESFGSGTITVGSGTTVTNTPITNTPVTNTTTPGTTTNTPVTNTPVTNTPVTNTPVTQTNTPGTNTPSPTGTHTPSSTPTKTNTATPTPTGTPHPSGHRAVIPEVARDGTS